MRTTIGRDSATNDIVLRHGSVSRTHAAITRDVGTGSYFVADLRSTNGVRVNGNQYGKVELRAGDYVDLGWVRCRFVAPGESFLFTRDAVVTPLPTREQPPTRKKRSTREQPPTRKKRSRGKKRSRRSRVEAFPRKPTRVHDR